ncbi:MAG: hypothetical protein A2017_20755 [Lentisphaerae bacterium GWF2_44_16]|nr:MAG: hypothetical protein A2017_20755 [Lentisphaerae bacterium GWF2_44_16]
MKITTDESKTGTLLSGSKFLHPKLLLRSFMASVIGISIPFIQDNVYAENDPMLIEITSGQGRILKADKSEVGKEDNADSAQILARFRLEKMTMKDHVIHYQNTKDVNFEFSMIYDVINEAPIMLTSQKGLGYEWYGWQLGYEPEWLLYNYSSPRISQVYARERIDLSQKGVFESVIPVYASDQVRGAPLVKGIHGVAGLFYLYYILDAKSDKYLDASPLKNDPWMKLAQIDGIGKNLTFTLANLQSYSLRIDDFKGNWKAGGEFHMRIKLKDADGDEFNIPRADVSVKCVANGQTRPIPIEAVFDENGIPQNYYRGKLPDDAVADELSFEARVSCLSPDGRKETVITKVFKKGDGATEKMSEPRILLSGVEKKLPSANKETRALYSVDVNTKESIDTLIKNLNDANFNVVIPAIWPSPDGVRLRRADNSELLNYLVERAHKSGLEVHPYYSVMNLKRAKDIMAQFGSLNPDGTRNNFACCHRPDFRKWVSAKLVEAVSKYNLDGINLDFIRTQSARCFCDYCKTAFKQEFGKDIADGNSDDWISWQEKGMREVVACISSSIKKVKPQAIVSAYCLVPQKRGGQRGWQWLNSGIIDVMMQSAYANDTFLRVGYVGAAMAKAENKDNLYPCLGVHSKPQLRVREPARLQEDIILMRQLGAKGIVLFCDHIMTDEHFRMLKEGPFAEKARPFFQKNLFFMSSPNLKKNRKTKMKKSKFSVGYGVSDITPSIGEFCSFRLSPNKRSLGVHDNLYAHALYLGNSRDEMILVSVDCVALPDVTVMKIKQAVREIIPLTEAQILLAATHTHNGAETIGEEPYVDNSLQIERILRGVTDAVSFAIENKFEARAAWGNADLPGIAKNRFAARIGSDITKVDSRADFLKIEDADGNYKGIFWHFAAHPTTCMKAGYMNSADYYGVANKLVMEKLGGFCFFFNGACGNINPELGKRSFERSEHFGREIAEKLIPEIPIVETSADIDLKSDITEISIPLTSKKPDISSVPSRDEILEYFKNISSLEILPDEYEKHWLRYQSCRTAWWRHKLIDILKEKDSENIKVAAHKIGDTFILTVPGEIFIEFQFELQNAFPSYRAMIFGYSNGYCGYIPDAASFEFDTYETIPTLFHKAGKNAGAEIVKKGVTLIHKLSQK